MKRRRTTSAVTASLKWRASSVGEVERSSAMGEGRSSAMGEGQSSAMGEGRSSAMEEGRWCCWEISVRVTSETEEMVPTVEEERRAAVRCRFLGIPALGIIGMD